MGLARRPSGFNFAARQTKPRIHSKQNKLRTHFKPDLSTVKFQKPTDEFFNFRQLENAIFGNLRSCLVRARRLRRRPSLTPHTHAPRSRQPLHRQRRRQKYLRFRTWIKQKQCDTFNLMDLISKASFQHCAQDTTLSKQHIDKAIVCAFVTPGCCKTISLTITAK